MTPSFDIDLEAARARRSLKWRRYPADVIPLWVAEMDYQLAEPVTACLAEMVERGDFGYPPEPPEADASEFRSAVVRWMGLRHGWSLEADDVSVVPDTMRVIEIAVEQFTGEGSRVVLADPVYFPFRMAIEDAGRVPLWVPMVRNGLRWELDLDALAAAFAEPDVSLYLHCHPHNPTGSVSTADELRAIAALADRHGVIVVSDEVHADLEYGTRHVPYATVAAPERTITASAASKAFNLAGLRCGYAVIGDPGLRERFRSFPLRGRISVALPGYEATIAAYRSGEAWIDAVVAHLVSMRDHVIDRLSAIDESIVAARPEGTYLLWTDWRHLSLPSGPESFLLDRARVALSPGAAFGPSGNGFMRLNFATSRSILDAAIDRIEHVLR